MNNILVIDDLRIMDFDCVYARDLNSAWDMLFRSVDHKGIRKWDEVWFDHDLGYGLNLDLPPQMELIDIRPIVTELENRANIENGWPVPEIGMCFIHTSNPAGRDWIRRGLENTRYSIIIADNPPVIGYVDKEIA